MKRIWARIGMSLDVSDAQYEVLRHLAAEHGSEEEGEPLYNDLELQETMVQEFLKRGEPDGDSYIPMSIFESIEAENKERGKEDMKTETIKVAMEDLNTEWADKLKGLDRQAILENVRYKFISNERKEKVGAIVSREFADVHIGYAVMFDDGDDYTANVVMTSNLIERMGITAEELEKAAFENTSKDEYEIKPMLQVLAEISGVDTPQDEFGMPMYVITNKRRVNGAVSMLIPEVMRNASWKLGGDFLILPSSVHEVIAISADTDVDFCRKMVSEINENEVEPQDRLSNAVFRYDCRKGEVVVAERSGAGV